MASSLDVRDRTDAPASRSTRTVAAFDVMAATHRGVMSHDPRASTSAPAARSTRTRAGLPTRAATWRDGFMLSPTSSLVSDGRSASSRCSRCASSGSPGVLRHRTSSLWALPDDRGGCQTMAASDSMQAAAARWG